MLCLSCNLNFKGEVALDCKFGLFLVLQQDVSLFWQQGDIEGDLAPPAAKRLKRTASDDTQEGVSAEEMSLYYSTPTSSDTSQVLYLLAVLFGFFCNIHLERCTVCCCYV